MRSKKYTAFQLTFYSLLLYLAAQFLLVGVQTDKPFISGIFWRFFLMLPLIAFIPSIITHHKTGLNWYSFVSLAYVTWLSSGLLMHFEPLRLITFLLISLSFLASLFLSRWRNLD